MDIDWNCLAGLTDVPAEALRGLYGRTPPTLHSVAQMVVELGVGFVDVLVLGL